MNALDDYKRKSGRMFPTCSEVLEVVRGLGYLKVPAAGLEALRGANASEASAKPMPSDWEGSVATDDSSADDSSARAEEPQMAF
jgi:hypothetical protein